MTPASVIVERCGGFRTVAEWLGLERTAVQRWTYEPPKGTGNQVPMKHWTPLIEAAERAGIAITIEELMPPDVARIARAQGFAAANEHAQDAAA